MHVYVVRGRVCVSVCLSVWVYVFVLTTLAYNPNDSGSGILNPESRTWASWASWASLPTDSRIITLTRLLRPFYELLKKCWEHVACVAAIPPPPHSHLAIHLRPPAFYCPAQLILFYYLHSPSSCLPVVPLIYFFCSCLPANFSSSNRGTKERSYCRNCIRCRW